MNTENFPLTQLIGRGNLNNSDINIEPEYNPSFLDQLTEFNTELNTKIYEDKLKNMKSKRVLLVGGPKDGEVQEIPSDYSEIHMYMMKEPLSFDPLAEPREEKTLVINKKGEKQWVGWDEREDPIESTNLIDTKEFIYDIVKVYLDRDSFIFIGVPKGKEDEEIYIGTYLGCFLSKYDTKLTEDIIKNEYKNSIIRIII